MYNRIGVEKLARRFGKVKMGNILKPWYKSRVLFIPKKEGRLLDEGEFRPVMVTKTSYKLFGEIMREKFSDFAEIIV